MVLLRISPQITLALRRARTLDLLPKLPTIPSEPSLLKATDGDPISYGQLIDLAALLAEHDPSQKGEYALTALLQGSEVYAPPKAKRAGGEETYAELMARLRREEEDRVYEGMLTEQAVGAERRGGASVRRRVPLTKTAQEREEKEEGEVTYSDVNRQIVLVINVLISIVFCGMGIWMVARQWSTPARLAMSMCGGGAVGVAEVVIYMGYLRRLTEAKRKERQRSEKKVIVDTWVIKGSAKADVTGVESVSMDASDNAEPQVRNRKIKA